MKEKELKIKQKLDVIKTRTREKNLFHNPLKTDFIKKIATEKKEQSKKYK